MEVTTYKVAIAVLMFVCLMISDSQCGIPLNSFLSASNGKLERDADDVDNFDEETANIQGVRGQDLRKLILKKLRFRDLDDQSPPSLLESIQFPVKRDQDNLVDKVAALLSGLKVRQISDSPSVRMPSLRFG
ncbi:uncharacterized protein LOC110450963 [Mizuhopecten yessoensis]|uniref:LRF n=1 Tax=Mizuhopecten yessoensis TaxID=6573 RepID=A0A210QMQ6_MIZYE|nr:uncharacterized protein LOC110450963 [Mizuhopecten yessoensis]AXN93519.1 LRF [Mizuhopecten yessoensis]OWF50019.1 hypothetical protein KP79_PYT03834 [Mizuhopecten yessoensis]